MAYNTKKLLTDRNGDHIPQSYDSDGDRYVPSEIDTRLKAIENQQQEILERLDKPIDTQVTGSNVEYPSDYPDANAGERLEAIEETQESIINALQTTNDNLNSVIKDDKLQSKTILKGNITEEEVIAEKVTVPAGGAVSLTDYKARKELNCNYYVLAVNCIEGAYLWRIREAWVSSGDNLAANDQVRILDHSQEKSRFDISEKRETMTPHIYWNIDNRDSEDLTFNVSLTKISTGGISL